jgi:hypothetical protein
MTMTPKRFVTAQVAASIAAVYTTALGTRAVIKRAAFTNTTGGAITLLVHLVPPSGSVTDGNMAIKNLSIAAGDTYIAGEIEGQVIEPTGSIHAEASASGSITAIISGVEVT